MADVIEVDYPELTDDEIAAARERGRIADETEARATAARYDRETGRIIVDLRNEGVFSFPARLAQGLENATDDQLAEVEVIGMGYGLHWESLNEDHAMPALVAGIMGNRRYMAKLAARTATPKAGTAVKASRPRKAG